MRISRWCAGLVLVALLAWMVPGSAVSGSVRELFSRIAAKAIDVPIIRVKRVRGVQAEGDSSQPSAIRVPADKTTKLICGSDAQGMFRCLEFVHLKCPDDIIIVDAASGIGYECDVTCGAPDQEGNCDCQVRYDTCRAVD